MTANGGVPRDAEREAEDFLRLLYREGRLTGAELSEGLRALKRLAAGKLRPDLRSGKNHRANRNIL